MATQTPGVVFMSVAVLLKGVTHEITWRLDTEKIIALLFSGYADSKRIRMMFVLQDGRRIKAIITSFVWRDVSKSFEFTGMIANGTAFSKIKGVFRGENFGSFEVID